MKPLVLFLETIWEEDWWLVDGAVQALEALGPTALEPALRELNRATDLEIRELLVGALAQYGVGDDRIWSELVAQLARAPERAAGNLAAYGDSRALPLLQQELARTPLRDPNEGYNREIIELRAAILELGGELPEHEEQRFRVLQAALRTRAKGR